MIALVACGHSLGGVQCDDFLEIINSPVPKNIQLFDNTSEFENTVVTGYLQSVTHSPLVAGPNTTTNSDLRIFSSDGNATMQSLASPEAFESTCAALFERMINTVPKGVKLTKVVEPIKTKLAPPGYFPATMDFTDS
ncbi:hypothetical protein PM082_002236 [Marasmius tenuissimus]|nr:hypothetical protein PM082_002236 [Marasmius tenuissimus]